MKEGYLEEQPTPNHPTSSERMKDYNQNFNNLKLYIKIIYMPIIQSCLFANYSLLMWEHHQ
jgi:hypothetical protein